MQLHEKKKSELVKRLAAAPRGASCVPRGLIPATLGQRVPHWSKKAGVLGDCWQQVALEWMAWDAC